MLDNGKDKTNRGIVDFGIVDVDAKELKPVNKKIKFIGTTSDMSVFDLGEIEDKNEYHVGDKIKFKPSYMAVARLIHSRYTNIKII